MFSERFDTSRITIQRSLKWVLVAQAILATLLVLSGLKAQWTPGFGGNDALPAGPTTPGDQVRRYDPTRTIPDFTRTPASPAVEIPGDMPQRLQFEVIDRSEPGGEPGKAIFMNGQISSGDAERFTSFLASLEDAPKLVTLHSPGGNVSEALAIGRSLRAAELDTAMLPGLVCLSSCPYIFASGVKRTASRASAVGMHQHYYETPGYMPVFLAVEGIQNGQGETMEYLIEMGIDPGLMVHSLNTPPKEIYILAEDELLDTRLATETVD
ncbi:hypothetical protein [Roseibium aggregatum]|uniref:ATP-dependent protease ClpP protease subunit n=1 Tax=Roseibium aggregatum TaxID=187304 RepID=A0A939EHQ7_9HYPH|nr:hypothetical protein [Roseibium aggregatum]MBN9672921.1 hypothetical protein [Roseibium aggregatum]